MQTTWAYARHNTSMTIFLEINPKVAKAAKDAITSETPKPIRRIIKSVAFLALAKKPTLTGAELPDPFEEGIDKDESFMRLAFACGRCTYRKVAAIYNISRGQLWSARKAHPKIYDEAKKSSLKDYQSIRKNIRKNSQKI